jgi:hypothetical protein
VLTIDIAEILQERFELAPELFGALTVVAPVNTLLPGLILRMPPPEYDAPEIPRDPDSLRAGEATESATPCT